jgi:hypothetical protein
MFATIQAVLLLTQKYCDRQVRKLSLTDLGFLMKVYLPHIVFLGHYLHNKN